MGEFIKLLVREVLVQTVHSDDRDDPKVNLLVKFVFSQVVPCTDKRADNNLGGIVVQRTIDQEIKMIIGDTPAERIKWSRMQKGWLIKTLAAKVGINPATLRNIERKANYSIEMRTLRRLASELDKPIWYLGCFENMLEDTFFDRLEKARCYHGHTKVEMAAEIGVNKRTIFDWKDKELGLILKENALLYCKILD